MKKYFIFTFLIISFYLNSTSIDFERIVNIDLMDINEILEASKKRINKDTGAAIGASFIPRLAIQSGIGFPYNIPNRTITSRGNNTIGFTITFNFSEIAAKAYKKKYDYNTLSIKVIKLYSEILKKITSAKRIIESSQIIGDQIRTDSQVKLIGLYLEIINLQLEMYSYSNITYQYDNDKIEYDINKIKQGINNSFDKIFNKED